MDLLMVNEGTSKTDEKESFLISCQQIASQYLGKVLARHMAIKGSYLLDEFGLFTAFKLGTKVTGKAKRAL